MEELEKKINKYYIALCNLEEEKKDRSIERHNLYKNIAEQTLLKYLRMWYENHNEDPDISPIVNTIVTHNVHIYTKNDL